MKECFSRRAKRKPQSTDKGKSVSKSDSDALEPPRKRQCLNESKEVSVSENKVLNSDAHPDQSKNTVSTRKSQLVIGVNNVTRCLERNELAAGCVCLTAKPALVTRHILMLAATRSVPFVALPNLSQKVVEAVGGIKSALAIGFKVQKLYKNYYIILLYRIIVHVRVEMLFCYYFFFFLVYRLVLTASLAM